MNHSRMLLHEFLDGGELLLYSVTRFEFPRVRNHREAFSSPSGEAIGFRLGQLKQMAKAPRHDVTVLAHDMSVCTFSYTQNISDRSTKRRFFSDKQTRHIRSYQASISR